MARQALPGGPAYRDRVSSASLADVDAPPSTAALRLHGVTRAHAGRQIWRPLDLDLESGTVVVVTGPNGSGKTTLLRVAAGLLGPSSGTRSCRGRALYLRGGAGLRSAQTVGEAVASTAGLVDQRESAGAALALVGLHDLQHRRLGTLSAGERVRAALACAVAVQPALLCLDEPTGVLDDHGVTTLVRVVEHLRDRGTATLVATHQPAALLVGADAHLQLRDGELVRA